MIKENKIDFFFNFCHYELLCYTAKSTIILFIIMICKKSYFHLSLRDVHSFVYFVCPGLSAGISVFQMAHRCQCVIIFLFCLHLGWMMLRPVLFWSSRL